MADDQGKIALLAGASGLTGSLALEAMLSAPDFSRVIAVTRRPLGRENLRLANRIVQFERLEAQLQGVSCDVALCCLGTTRARAGSLERFRAVDFGYTLAFARAALAARAQRFVVVSSVGADPASGNLYLRTKGEMEVALTDLGFPSLDILQPGPLLGRRSENGALELLTSALMPLVNLLLRGSYLAYRGVSARTVAAALLGATRSGRRGVQRYDYAAIEALARVAPQRAAAPAPGRKSAGAR